MWQVMGESVDPAMFGDFVPIVTLIYYDGPLSFSFVDADFSLCLAHWADTDENANRYLVVPIEPDELIAVRNCKMPIRDALEKPVVFVVDCGDEGIPIAAWRCEGSSIPEDCLPTHGIMIGREPSLS